MRTAIIQQRRLAALSPRPKQPSYATYTDTEPRGDLVAWCSTLKAQDDLPYVTVGQAILQAVRSADSSDGPHASQDGSFVGPSHLLSCAVKVNQQVRAFRVSTH
jgi:hypothetical protein